MSAEGSRDRSGAQDDLRRELAHAREQHAAVARVLETLSRDPSDLQRVLKSILENAVRLSGADVAWLPRVKDGELLVPNLAAYGVPPDIDARPAETMRVRPGPSIAGHAVMRRETVHSEDVTTDPQFTSSNAAFRYGARTALAVPLVAAEDVVGVLVVARREVRRFSDEEIEVIETFAHQAAIAMRGAELATETRAALEQQTAISDLLGVISRSGFHLDAMLTVIIERATKLAGADNGAIRQIIGTDVTVVASTASYPQEFHRQIAEERHFVPDRTTVTGRVLVEKRPVQIPDVPADHEYVPISGDPVKAILGVPMLRGTELI